MHWYQQIAATKDDIQDCASKIVTAIDALGDKLGLMIQEGAEKLKKLDTDAFDTYVDLDSDAEDESLKPFLSKKFRPKKTGFPKRCPTEKNLLTVSLLLFAFAFSDTATG